MCQLYKPRDTKPGELTWWRFLEMGSSGGENHLCAIFLVQEPIRATKSRAVASRIVWTLLLISLEPNHVT